MKMRTAFLAITATILAQASAAMAQTAAATSQPANVLIDVVSATSTWAKFACIISAGTLIAVFLMRQQMQALARNQVELAKMIQTLKK